MSDGGSLISLQTLARHQIILDERIVHLHGEDVRPVVIHREEWRSRGDGAAGHADVGKVPGDGRVVQPDEVVAEERVVGELRLISDIHVTSGS